MARLVEAMEPQFCRVLKRTQESEDVFTLVLAPPSPKAKVKFAPGQFNMLYSFGVGEVAISISGDNAKSNHWVHTIRSVGATTEAISNLKVGDLLGVRGPYGTAWPIAEAEGQDVILVAGGLGLAPLRPVLYHVINHRQRYGQVTLLYGARSYRDLLFQKETAAWKKAGVEIFISLGQADRKWKGAVGHVISEIDRLPIIADKTSAFLCGPEVMMRFGAVGLEKRGVTGDKIFVSMERNMKCAIGFCGHCQLGPTFICKDGPVYPYRKIEPLMRVREL